MDATKINLTDPEFWKGPVNLKAFAALRRDLPVSWHDFVDGPERGMKGFWSLTRYDDIVQVSQNAGLFRNQPSTYIGDQTEEEAQYEGWFLNMDGPRHFMLRSVVQKILSPKGLEKYRENALGHATDLVMAAKEKGEVDFAREVAQPYPVAVICDFLGAPPSDRKHMHYLTQHALAGDAPELGGPASVPAYFKELNDYGAALSRERRKAPKDDFVSYLHTVEVEGRRFTDEEVGIQFQLLVTAGMETTGTVGGHMMRLFMENPDQMALWAADPDGMAPVAVEEMVRLVTPVMHMRRTAAEDTEIAGQKIAAGDKVVLWFISGNRDETKFAHPDHFHVTRSPNPHIGFGGGGRHTCLGAHLARMELPILAKLTLEHLKNPEPMGDPVYVASRFANGLLSLPVRFNQGGAGMTHAGKTYVLTGVSSGVGAAVAADLAARGATVVGIDRAEPKTPLAAFHRCDLADPTQIDATVAVIGGPIDGLVNIAGVPGSLPVETVIKVNYLAVRRLTEALLPRIADHGAVVNVASTAGANWRARADLVRSLIAVEGWEAGLKHFLGFGFPSVQAYDVSKEAVILYSMLVSSRERHRGVRVNTVSPGAVQTPILATFYDTMGADLLGRLRTQAGGRDARPEEIAGPIAFLLSRDAQWVNGVDLIADGGAEVSLTLEGLASPAKTLAF